MKKEMQQKTTKSVKYKDLDKDTLVRLGREFDAENQNQLFNYLQNHKLSFKMKQSIPSIIKITDDTAVMVDYDYYHRAFKFSAKDQLLRNANVKNFIKENPGNTLFKIKAPEGFYLNYSKNNCSQYFTVNGVYNAFELGYCLLLESKLSEIRICNKHEKEIFYLKLNENQIFSGSIIRDIDNKEDSLDKILNDLCGCADYISLKFCDNNTAERLDEIGSRFSKLFRAILIKEEK